MLEFLKWCVILSVMLMIGGFILNVLFMLVVGIIAGISSLFSK